MPDGYNGTVAIQQFDAARRLFFHAVDQFLGSADLAPEERADEIAATKKVLQDKLRLMGW